MALPRCALPGWLRKAQSATPAASSRIACFAAARLAGMNLSRLDHIGGGVGAARALVADGGCVTDATHIMLTKAAGELDSRLCVVERKLRWPGGTWGSEAAGCGRLENETMRMLSLFGVAVLVMATGALAHDRWGNPNWIANGHFVSPIDGSHCCGVADCVELSSSDVQETTGGYFLNKLNETVPFREVQVSRDGQYWRCKKPDGSRRCFFAPPPSI